MNHRTRTILRNVAVAPIAIPARIPCVLLILLGWACLNLSSVLLRVMRWADRADAWVDALVPGLEPVPPLQKAVAKAQADRNEASARAWGTDAYNGPFAD